MTFLENKVAIVTGGASGIGYVIVDQLLKNGAKGVAILDISEENGKGVEKTFQDKYGDKVLFIKTDVTKESEQREAYEKTITKFKNLDIVVNNVGILNEPKWRSQLAVNVEAVLTGTYLAHDEYLLKYRSTNEALIMNTSSVLGLDPSRYAPAYCATKSAVIALGRGLGKKEHYDRTNVRILTICPGFVETPFVWKAITKEGYPNHRPDEYLPIAKDILGEHIAWIMNEGKSGSVWVIEETERYEVNFPSRREMKSET